MVMAAIEELKPGWLGTQWSKKAVATASCQSIDCLRE